MGWVSTISKHLSAKRALLLAEKVPFFHLIYHAQVSLRRGTEDSNEVCQRGTADNGHISVKQAQVQSPIKLERPAAPTLDSSSLEFQPT